MKKILFVMQSLRIGGAERVLVTIANKLVKAGYDVTILIWCARFTFREDLDDRVHLIYRPTDQHIGDRIPYIRSKFYDESMWLVRASPRQLYRYYVGYQKFDVEVAFFHGYALDIVSGSANKTSKKIAWIHHDIRRLQDAAPDNWEKTVEEYKKIRNIVCVSESARDSFIETVGDSLDTRVIYNLLSAEDIRRKAKETAEVQVSKSPFHIIMVGSFRAVKGHQRLVESVVALHDEGKDISLALVGEGDKEGHVLQLIEEKNAGGYISVLNAKNNPYPYIAEADLLVCSSFSEGYNLTLAEAMILGVPVLSTDCSGPREILGGGEYGMLVENSKEGILDGIRTLYDSPSLLKKFKQKAIERQSFFDEDKIFKQITDLFDED